MGDPAPRGFAAAAEAVPEVVDVGLDGVGVGVHYAEGVVVGVVAELGGAAQGVAALQQPGPQRVVAICALSGWIASSRRLAAMGLHCAI